MTYGFRVKKPGGTHIDPLTSVGRYLGQVIVTNNGSLVEPALTTGIPDFVVVRLSANTYEMEPSVSISGTTLSWTYHTDQSVVLRAQCAILYWVR